MKRKVFAFLLITLAMSGCSKKQVFTTSQPMMDTVVTLTVAAEEKAAADRAFDAAFSEIRRAGALLGPSGENSAVAKINKAAADTPVKVDPEVFKVIERSLKFSRLSEGGFDITFASAGDLWDFTSNPFVIPSKEEITDALEHVGYNQLKLDPGAGTVTKTDRNVKIGLGGIAKGYIIDKALAAMQDAGAEAGIVDAGGDIRVLGRKNRKRWITGVRDPRREDSLVMAVAMDDGEACATSGDYERMVIAADDTRYHHIIDPRTGYPTETFSSVTVITDNAMDADAYATAFFVMGISHTIEYVSTHDDVEVILIDRHMNTYASKSLKGDIENIDESITIEWLERYK